MRLDLVAIALLAAVATARADPADVCAAIGNDDTVRPYEASLRQGFSHAFKTLFPDARGAASDAMMRAEGAYRCMDGKLVACFTGANLPCAKIAVARDNPAVDRYCAAIGTTDVVPLVVSGHDSEYSYRCQDGTSVVAGEQWALDKRGFATKLWAPME